VNSGETRGKAGARTFEGSSGKTKGQRGCRGGGGKALPFPKAGKKSRKGKKGRIGISTNFT